MRRFAQFAMSLLVGARLLHAVLRHFDPRSLANRVSAS